MQLAEPAIWPADTSGPPLREVTLGQALEEQARLRPEAPAFVFHDGAGVVRWSYAELQARVQHLARALMALGFRQGDRVGVLSPNSPEWLLLEYALAKVGAVLVTVNPALRREEIAYVLRQGRLSGLFAVGEYRGHRVGEAIAAVLADQKPGEFRHLVSLGDEPMPGARSFEEVLGGAEAVGEAELARRAAAVRPEDVAQIQYTSGTTGAPKGAMLTHRSTVNNARLMAARAGFTGDDRLLSAMPLFHTAGCVCNVMGMLAVGGCFVTMPGFEAAHMLELVEAERATVINAVPTMWQRMLEEPELERRDVSSLRIAFAGGTSIPPSLMRELKERVGADPMLIMGMTECSPIITQTMPSDDFETKITTAGRPLPHTEIMVADVETGEPVRLGEKGELRIRGYLVTKGYFDMPDRTAETIDGEGWLRSGDLAVLSEGGYLQIVGRLKDMLIRGGENVYPVEIEDFLLTHPDVAEAQVVGVPDTEMGEEIFAFIVPRPGARVEPRELQDYCRAGIARHKMPRYVECVSSLPTTANGKVQKFELRRIAAEIVAGQGAA